MARAMKRQASRSAGAARKKRASPVAKKCALIAPAIKAAESLPQPVRSIISDRLVHVFGTYKEDRHDFQNTVSKLVGKTLKATEADLQQAISDAEAKKASAAAEGASLTDASNAANAASEAAASTAAESKAALATSQAALRDAKTGVHDAEAAVKSLQERTDETTLKKDGLAEVRTNFLTEVKEGRLDKGLSKSASWAGKKLGKDFPDNLDKEFLVCVVRTFSKPAAEWGTFDHIVDKELDGKLQEIAAGLEGELSTMAGQKDPTAAAVETAKSGQAAAEEQLKVAEEALKAANQAASDAKAAAKSASDAVRQQEKVISKASTALDEVNAALKSFQEGALAAFAEVEAHTAPPPPPEPEPVAEEPAAAAAAPLEQAMTAAPAQASQTSPGILPSPGVLLTRAASAVASRLAPSPRVQNSPGRAN